MQLAANWPDKHPECQVIASDQCGNPNVKSRAIITKQEKSVQVQRLSEAGIQFGWVNKSSDSPIPSVTTDTGKKSQMLLEKDFRKIFQDNYQVLPMMVPDLFNIQTSEAAFEKTSAVGQVPDFVEFSGKVQEVSPTQGYDKTYTFTEYAAKIEIQRKLAAEKIVEFFGFIVGRISLIYA